MRVLNVCANMHPVLGGGTAERTFQMCRAFVRLGISTSLLTLDFGLPQEWYQKLAQVQVTALPVLNRRFLVPRTLSKVFRDLSEQADIIHLMGVWCLMNAMVYRQAWKQEKPYVFCPAGTLLIYGRSRHVKRAYHQIIGQKLVQRAAGKIAISKSEIPEFEANGVDGDSVHVIPNGIHLSDYQSRDDFAIRHKLGLADSPFLLFMGRLNPVKGPDLLIEAFSKLDDRYADYRLVIAGVDEGMGPELTDLARKLEISERVHFPGFIAGEEKSQALHAADLMVIPSRLEAMSIVVLEAGATATPVVLTDQCGMNEVETVGGGFVVPATAEGLREGIEKSLIDRENLGLMGKRLKKHTEEKYTWDSVGLHFLRFFNSIVEGVNLSAK